MRDKSPHNAQGEAHGYWIIHHDNNNIWFKGYYLNGQEFGYFEHWSYYNSSVIKEYYAI